MSLKYEIDGFEEKTYDRLINTQEKVGAGITPDNINYIPFELVSVDASPNIEYLFGSSINGYSVNGMYEMIAHLKTSKTELTYVTKETQILSPKMELDIEVPEGYDGRNSFVISSFNRQTSIGGANTFNWQFDPRIVVNALMGNNNGNTQPYLCSLFTTKNKRSIKLTINGYDKDNINNSSYYSIKVLVLLWRLV